MSIYSLLNLEKTAWQLLGQDCEPVGGEFEPEELIEQAACIAKALAETKQAEKPLVLGLATSWCLAATIDVPSPQLFRKPQLLHYQLEESIPWSAEEYVSDFIGHRQQAFSVAVRHQELAEFLAGLEAEGVQVAAIVPTTLLAVADHLEAESLSDHCLLWEDNSSIDVISVRQGNPLGWSRIPADATEVNRQLQQEQLAQGNTQFIYTRGFADDLEDSTPLPNVSLVEAACQASQKILAGQAEPSINLRQGELVGKQTFEVLGREFFRLKLAAVLLIVCVGFAIWMRGGQYQLATAEVKSELAELYTEIFPESKDVPERVGVAIEKEFRQLRGTRAPTADLPSPEAADTVLENLLQHLPQNMRFRLPEIRIEQDRLTLGGEVRTNADADLIATALRSHGFTVDPPRTQRLAEKGVGVRLQARVKAGSND